MSELANRTLKTRLSISEGGFLLFVNLTPNSLML
jgi:hypothetical protein